MRWKRFSRAVRAEPAVLVRDGAPVEAALRRERITHDELLSAVRESGGRDLDQAEVVLLEGDGSLTAILKG